MVRAFKVLCVTAYIFLWLCLIGYIGHIVMDHIEKHTTVTEPTVCIVETHHIDKKPYTVIVRNGKLKN